MKTIQIEIKDDYLDSILNFLKLLPESVAKIKELSDVDEDEVERELLSRVDDINSGTVKPITKEELFNDL